jgi:hypothetical protein
MKLKTLAILAGLALLAAPATGALAHADVFVDLDVGVPAPPAVYVEPAPPAYYYPPRVVYYRPYPHRYWYAPHYYYRHGYWRHGDWRDHGWHGRHHRD